jgi:hypothetical protein
MNGVESTGITGFSDHTLRVTGTSDGGSVPDRHGRAMRRPGMKDALTMSRDAVNQRMSRLGFIDIRAGATAQIQSFVQHGTREEEVGLGQDPILAAELAAQTGTQIGNDVSLAQRIHAYVDPARVAALLR